MPWIVAGVAAGVLALVIGVAYVVGSRLPRDHVAVVRARFAASAESLWAVLDDPLAAASWRKDVKRVERLPDLNGHPAWREETGFGPVTYELLQSAPGELRRIRIADDALPYGGEWEFRIAPATSGTELTITERGFVKPPMFRFMARYLFGYTSTLVDFQRELGVRLGEQVAPEVIATGK